MKPPTPTIRQLTRDRTDQWLAVTMCIVIGLAASTAHSQTETLASAPGAGSGGSPGITAGNPDGDVTDVANEADALDDADGATDDQAALDADLEPGQDDDLFADDDETWEEETPDGELVWWSPPADHVGPDYSFLRHQEDWSVLRGMDLSDTSDFWDPIKFVPLTDDGSVWLSFGGHARIRAENWHNFGFNDYDDDTFLLTRFLFHADAHLGEHVRVYAEGKSALSTERDLAGGRRMLDADELDLQQLFADFVFPVGDATLTLRPGRQMLSFGNQRLVSPLPWSNTLRTWDGVSAILEANNWTVTGFWTQFVTVDKFRLNDTDAQNELAGVYATGPVCAGANMDLYWLAIDRDAAAFNGTAGIEDRDTLGGRIWGDVAHTGLDYEVEGAYQTGSIGSGDIEAWMIAAEFGLELADQPGSPRFHAGFDYATGDETPGGDVETFNHLFPLGHDYFGSIDAIGRQNIMDLSTGVSFKALENLTIKLIGHFFWLADDDDSLYNANGAARIRTTGASKEVGQEVDFLIVCPIDRHILAKFGYSHFFTSNVIDDTGNGNSSDVDFIYFILQYTF